MFLNNGTATQPDFREDTSNPLIGVDVEHSAAADCFDVDGDGDKDWCVLSSTLALGQTLDGALPSPSHLPSSVLLAMTAENCTTTLIPAHQVTLATRSRRAWRILSIGLLALWM